MYRVLKEQPTKKHYPITGNNNLIDMTIQANSAEKGDKRDEIEKKEKRFNLPNQV